MSGGGSAASSSAGVEAPLKLPAVMPSSVTIEPVAVLPGHGDRVWHVSWCPTTNVLASASGDGTVRVWGKTSGGWGLLSVLEGEHDGHTIRHVSWSPSGTYLALACFDHTASVWRRSDEEEGGWEFEIEGILDGHESEVKCVAWATETTLATCSRDHTVWVWDRLDEGEYECGGVLTGHSQDVKHCTWLLPTSSAEDGARPLVISCGYDETVRVWADSHRSDDWHCVQTLKQHEGTVWAAAAQRLEPTMAEVRAAEEAGQPLPQPLLCTCSDDLRVLFWRRNAQGRFENVAAASGFSERSIFDVDWAPAGGAPLVACASGDDSVTLLGLSYAEAERQVHVGVVARLPAAHASDVNSVAFAHNGSLNSEEGLLLASAGDDNTVRIWRVRCQE